MYGRRWKYMQDKLGFHIGFNFVEAFALIENKPIEKRYFLSEFTEEAAISDFVTNLPPHKINTAYLTTKWPERILQKKIGTDIALLVTEGFQNWPNIRQPAFDKRYRRQPERTQSVIGGDFIFGLSERVNAQGKILKEPTKDEIDFLDAKLKLMGVKTIALGFLHSNQNPKNELLVEKEFLDRGYKVLCSHKNSTKDNEVARWWRSVLDAYVVDVFEEQRCKIADCLKQKNIDLKLLSNRGRAFEKEEAFYFCSNYAKTNCLSEYYSKHSQLLYLGLEDFILIKPQKYEKIYQSSFGPVGIHHVQQERLSLQPTQVISPDEWKLFHYIDEELGFEPGPMVLGKSLTPCLLDLLFVNGQLNKFESLKDYIRPNSKSRILEALYTFARESEFENRLDDFIELMMDVTYKKMAIQLAKLVDSKELTIIGPLASIIGPELKNRLSKVKIKMEKSTEFIDAKVTAEGDCFNG